MKLSYKFKKESFAKNFQESLKKEKSVEASLSQENDEFIVSFESNISEANSVGECENKKLKDEIMSYVYDVMEYQRYYIKELESYLMYLESAFYKHQEGHLPKIEGAGKMQKAMDVLGISEDYEVIKKPVFASTKRGLELRINSIE